MAYLANNSHKPLTAHEIAEGTGVPGGYLSKVLKSLIQAGLVGSRRGIGGGYTLARAPERISIMDVVNVFHPFRRVEACPMKLATDEALCPLHRHIDAAVMTLQQMFGATTLADLVREGRGAITCCEVGADQPAGSLGKPLPRAFSGDC